MSDPVSRKPFPEPSRKEFFGGLAILTILACVGVARQGQPERGYAVAPINDPLQAIAASDAPAEHAAPVEAGDASMVLANPAMIESAGGKQNGRR